MTANNTLDRQTDSIPETFTDFGLRPEILQGVEEAGFRAPSPIQKLAIPAILAGNDVIAQAQTGTGKTAAFGLPAMNAICQTGNVEVLIVVPTRELASQVSDELYRLGRFAGIRTVAVYGGQSIRRQVELIDRGSQVVTATPGRLLDHLRSQRIKLEPSIVILDEADEMLDMGFLEDIEEIFKYLPSQRQTLMFSATLPDAIRRLAGKILTDPVSIDITPKEVSTNTDIVQRYYVLEEREREEALVRLIDTEAPNKSLIFCRTKKETDSLSTTLISRGYAASSLHGDMQQRQRDEAIESFKKGRIELLVATDVAARGLDISDVTHVFNYHMPFDPDSYVHRIGRTGRAGKKGVAITLVTPLEFKKLRHIVKSAGAPIGLEEIPTLDEAERQFRDELIEKLERQHIHDGAADVLQRLEEDLDLSQIAYKAISILLDRTPVQGPDRIGFNAREVERMMNRFKRRKNYPKNNYKGRVPKPRPRRRN